MVTMSVFGVCCSLAMHRPVEGLSVCKQEIKREVECHHCQGADFGRSCVGNHTRSFVWGEGGSLFAAVVCFHERMINATILDFLEDGGFALGGSAERLSI